MSDYESVQKQRNLIVGVFVALGLCAAIWLVFKFGDLPTGVSRFRSFLVYVQFKSAPGVQKDTPVRFCGYQIGRVVHVVPPEKRPSIVNGKPEGPEQHHTVVHLSINRKFVNIPDNSQIRLMTRGLGSSYIEIKAPPVDPNHPVHGFLMEGSWVEGSTGVTSEFFPEDSQEKLEQLAVDLRTLVRNTNAIVGDSTNQQHVKTILENFAGVSAEASKTLAEAREAIQDYRVLAQTGQKTVIHADQKIDEMSMTLVGASDELGKAAAELRQMLASINAGEGTAGKLVNDGRLYERMLESAAQVETLLEEMRRFVARSKDKGFPIKLK